MKNIYAIYDAGKEEVKRFRLFACEIAYRELCLAVARAPHVIDIEFLPKGLHDLPSDRMRATIQERLDVADRKLYTTLLLGYGLCNNGVVGLTGRDLPLVLPRAHDCITFFMGSRARYQLYFDSHPGTIYRTTGWSERDFANVEGSIYERTGLDRSYEEYVELYGEENARYILETLGGWTKNYANLAFIDMGLVPELGYEEAGRARAQKEGWTFEILAGDWTLLEKFVRGEWDEEDFLIVPPGHRIAASRDDSIVRAERIESDAAIPSSCASQEGRSA